MSEAALAPELVRVDDIHRKLSFSIERAEVEEPLERRLKSMGSSMKMKGFRPGKIPMKVLRAHYEKPVLGELVREQAMARFSSYVEKEKPELAYRPSMTISPSDGAFEIQFEFDEMPEIVLPDLDAIELRRPAVEVSEADIDASLDEIRLQGGEAKHVDREARAGDIALFSYDLSKGGEVVWGTKGKVVAMPLDPKKALPELCDALSGKREGERGSFTLAFPEGHFSEHFAGGEYRFDYQLKSLTEVVRAELEPEFVKSLGIEDGAVESLRERMGETLAGENSRALLDMVYRKRVERALMAPVPEFSLPQAMVDDELRSLTQARLRKDLEGGYPAADFATRTKSEIEERVRRRVRCGLVVRSLAAKNDVQVTPDSLKQFFSSFPSEEEASKAYERFRSDQHYQATVRAVILESAVFGIVFSKAKIEEEKLSIAQLRRELEEHE